MMNKNRCLVHIGPDPRKGIELAFTTTSMRWLQDASGKDIGSFARMGADNARSLEFLVLAVGAGLQHLPQYAAKLEPNDKGRFDLRVVDELLDGMQRPMTPARREAIAALKAARAAMVKAREEAAARGVEDIEADPAVDAARASFVKATEARDAAMRLADDEDDLSTLASKVGKALTRGLPGVLIPDEDDDTAEGAAQENPPTPASAG